MEATFFKNTQALREWFHQNHATAKEIWIGYYKKNSGKANFTWSESVDEAICYGWIDGIRKSIDAERYKIRFTPRKPTSNWSAVNVKKVEELTAKGLMQPSGLAAYAKLKEGKSKVYSFEQDEIVLAPVYEQQIKANTDAWTYFEGKLSPYYKNASIWYVMSAKREATRQKRIQLLIESCEKEEKLPQFISKKK